MLNRDTHRHILFQILKDIFQSDIGKYLAFKGGTACYFLYGLDRFSTDLDFDIIGDADIDVSLTKILQKYGTAKSGQRIVLSYGDTDTNIKVDVSRKIWKANQYEVVNFYGTDIRVQDRDTIFANKLVALTERSTNRDIYDAYFFFQKFGEINEEVIMERTGKTTKALFVIIRDKLKHLSKNHKILDGLGEVLNEKQKSFVKAHLVPELIGILDMKIDTPEI